MKKTLASALITGGIVVGSLTGVAMASAEPGADRGDQTEETTNNAGIVNVQDANDEQDGDNEGRRGRKGQRLAAAAELIGIEADELRSALQDGQTLAEVAEENGVEAQDVIDSMVASLSERLDAKVESGDITAEEAAEKLAEKTERISNKVNGIDNDTETA